MVGFASLIAVTLAIASSGSAMAQGTGRQSGER
jgi:hypothetical protein